MTISTILALILLLVPASRQTHNDETEADARVRYDTIADAVAHEAGTDERLGLFMLTVARHESTFRRDTHSGKHRGDAGRSVSIFQIKCKRGDMARVPFTDFRVHEIVGVDIESTRNAASAVATILRPRIKGCGGAPLCVFKAYGGIAGKPAPDVQARLDARVATYRRLVFERRRK